MTGARHTINANGQSILVDFSPDAKLDECLNVLSIWLWHVRDGSYPTTVVPRYERMSIRRAPFISTDAPPHFRVSSTVLFLEPGVEQPRGTETRDASSHLLVLVSSQTVGCDQQEDRAVDMSV